MYECVSILAFLKKRRQSDANCLNGLKQTKLKLHVTAKKTTAPPIGRGL